MHFNEFVSFMRLVSELRYSKQACYQIFKTFKDEELIADTKVYD